MEVPVIRISIGMSMRTKPMSSKLASARVRRGSKPVSARCVSIWRTLADANEMATFAPMLALAEEFIALGVRFRRPILNFETLWQIDKRVERAEKVAG